MERFPDGTYAEFCRKQASAEAQADEEPQDENPDEIIQQAPEPEEKTADGLKKSRTLTSTDKLGRSKTLSLDPEISAKLDQADEDDKKVEENVTEFLKPLRAKSDFAKVMTYNSHKILIIPALMALAACGFSQPYFGYVFAKLMQIMTLPLPVMI